MNKVILIGRLTADPELRYTPNGSAVCDFTLAVERVVSDGEKKADFIFCNVWNKQAESLAKYMRKGQRIGVEGRLSVENYEKDGQRKWATRVVCQRIEFLESKQSNGAAQKDQGEKGGKVVTKNGEEIGVEVSFRDEDLPF